MGAGFQRPPAKNPLLPRESEGLLTDLPLAERTHRSSEKALCFTRSWRPQWGARSMPTGTINALAFTEKP